MKPFTNTKYINYQYQKRQIKSTMCDEMFGQYTETTIVTLTKT